MKKILIILETLGLLTIISATTIACLDTTYNYNKTQNLNRENPFKIPTEIKKIPLLSGILKNVRIIPIKKIISFSHLNAMNN